MLAGEATPRSASRCSARESGAGAGQSVRIHLLDGNAAGRELADLVSTSQALTPEAARVGPRQGP